MEKLYSHCIGMSVINESTSATVSRVKDILIDPDTGKVLAFLLPKKFVVVPLDIERAYTALIISDTDKMVPLEEVLRVNAIYKMNIGIIGAKVFTEKEHQYLGKVFDYEIDMMHLCLTKLHVAKILFFFHLNERIIPFMMITRITKDRVYVKESSQSAKEKVASQSQMIPA